MKINLKSQKGAVTLIVLVTMLFLIAFLMTMYIRISNKAQTSAETTKQIAEKYNNIGEAEAIYNSYFANSDVIPIYTRAQLEKIGSGEQVTVNGKIYTFTPSAYYTIQNDLDLGGYDKEKDTWVLANKWTSITNEFTGTLDGLGHTISGLYINDSTANYQGLFGTLKGTVKNLSIAKSYIKAKSYVGSIAGKNEGTIENCYNTGSIIGETNVTGGYFKSITTGAHIDVWSDNVLDENAYFVSGAYTATAPKGFKVSKNVSEQTIEDGLVIQDASGNEFVWIPVKEGTFERIAWWENEPTTQTLEEIIKDFTEDDYKGYIATKYGYDTIDDMTKGKGYENYEEMLDKEWGGTTLESTIAWFKDCYWWAGALSNAYTENAGNDPTGEYANMVASVAKYGGFYIGRYEAGTDKVRTKQSGTTEMVVKQGAYPYNYVCWGTSMTNYESEYTGTSGSNTYNIGHGAVYLSKNMYTDKSTYGVTSTLCYGVQWDAILRFIKDKVDVTNSTTWGNYSNHKFTFSGKYSTDSGKTWSDVVTNETKPVSELYLLTTGASETNKAKNIYDLAGNVFEWTMEARSSTNRVNRGGSLRRPRRRLSSFCTWLRRTYGQHRQHRFPPLALYNKRIVCYINKY